MTDRASDREFATGKYYIDGYLNRKMKSCSPRPHIMHRKPVSLIMVMQCRVAAK
jgi:hypothetical protein